MRFGLYGIYGVYNLGCEAIVRGTVKFLRDSMPNCEIIYFSYNYENDVAMLKDLKIEIFKLEPSRSILKRCINKGLALLGTEKRLLDFDYSEITNRVDALISIGGDIYTIPEVMRKGKKYAYYNTLVDVCNRVIKKGKKVIVYGASMGPWGEYSKAIAYYIKNLKKYETIICREYETEKYLKELGFNNVIFMPDPAFLVESSVKNIVEKKYIGINLSPLSLKELYGKYDGKTIEMFSNILKEIYDVFSCEILLIPHVVSSNEMDNDKVLLEQIADALPNYYRDHVTMANISGGFLGLKNELRGCHFVVSARMHCAVNAICEGVPAIFLSYSQKSVGMSEYIYNSEQWVLNIKEIESQLLPKMKEMFVQKDKIEQYLDGRLREIALDYDSKRK